VDYGQRHRVELEAAARIARRLGAVEHRVVRIDLAQFGGSALTDTSITVPDQGVKAGIPITYVPARNTNLLSLEKLAARWLFAPSMSIFEQPIWLGRCSTGIRSCLLMRVKLRPARW
jgi:7-cyano-7-deazaguanine synthase in queuosine biosynthesis